MGICYIVGAGEFYGSLVPTAQDFVIAADGGYTALVERGIRCDLLIGDMDSLSARPSGVELITHPVEKDETDTYLAYLEGVKRGYTHFEVYGGVGGREDHTFANYCLLIYGVEHGHRISLVSERYNIFAIKNEKISLSGDKKKTISLFAFGGEARGVSIRGLKYEASDITLSASFPLGVSNSFTDTNAEIEVADGTLLIMAEK